MLRASFIATLIAWSHCTLVAQAPYVSPTDTAVAHKLAQWQDLTFGLLMHWGTYCQWGIVESLNICPEDEDRCNTLTPDTKRTRDRGSRVGGDPQ